MEDSDSNRLWPRGFASAVWLGIVWLIRLLIAFLRFLGWFGGMLFLALLVILSLFVGPPDIDRYLRLPDRTDNMERQVKAQTQRIDRLERRVVELTAAQEAQAAEIGRLEEVLDEPAEPESSPQLIPRTEAQMPPTEQSQSVTRTMPVRTREVLQQEDAGWPWWYWVVGVIVSLVAMLPILAAIGSIFGERYGVRVEVRSPSSSHEKRTAA